MRDGVVHIVGHLNNRQDPIKLGTVSEDNPTVSYLKVAQNIDIDEQGVATTRDGQVERLLGDISSLWVHPQDDKIAYFLERVDVVGPDDVVVDGSFAVAGFVNWITIDEPTWSIGGGQAIATLSSAKIYQDTPDWPVGTFLRVTVDVDSLSSGSINAYVGDSQPTTTLIAAGISVDDITVGSGTQYGQLSVGPASSNTTAVINSISVVEIDAIGGNPVGGSVISSSSVLKQLNTDFTSTEIVTLNSFEAISFELINGVVFLSNGVDIGFIDGGTFSPFSQTLLRDELPMPAGKYIAFNDNDGCLLVASGSIVYKSKPWNPQVRDARFSEFPMNGAVRMLASVEDGWWVATDKNISFAKMDGEDGYTFKHISDNVPPDGCFEKHLHFDRDDNGKTSSMEVHWASQDGFCEGKAGGAYLNHSYPNVTLPEGDKGKFFSRNVNGTEQFLAVIFNPIDDHNFVAPTLLKNIITP